MIQKTLLSRDENSSTRTSGGVNKPLHNLGFLHSTASHPARYSCVDTNDQIIRNIPPHLKYMDFDAIYANTDVSTCIMWPAKFREVFSPKLSPPWQWQARFLDIFGNTEGGAMPSSIESAAPYTPLNTSNFTGVLDDTANNVQAAFEMLDDHNHDTAYAPIGEGVTNGDSHDHSGGDGAQIDHTGLANKGTNTHAQLDTFIASKAAASGLASLDGSSKVVQDPANATATPTAGKIPIADGDGTLDDWITPGGDGNVVGPDGAVDGNVAIYNGVTGLIVKDGGKRLSMLSQLLGEVHTIPMVSFASAKSMAAGTIFYLGPFTASRDMNAQAIAFTVTTAVASGAARLGIFACDDNLVPTTLLLDAGTILTESTGIKSIAIDFDMTAGTQYYFALHNKLAFSARAGEVLPQLGLAAVTTTIAVQSYFSQIRAYASGFTDPAVPGAIGTGVAPIIYVGVFAP
jgi:hypothetical protein